MIHGVARVRQHHQALGQVRLAGLGELFQVLILVVDDLLVLPAQHSHHIGVHRVEWYLDDACVRSGCDVLEDERVDGVLPTVELQAGQQVAAPLTPTRIEQILIPRLLPDVRPLLRVLAEANNSKALFERLDILLKPGDGDFLVVVFAEVHVHQIEHEQHAGQQLRDEVLRGFPRAGPHGSRRRLVPSLLAATCTFASVGPRGSLIARGMVELLFVLVMVPSTGLHTAVRVSGR
mmetsp:Transcript_53904/g.135465  ORF Transcript_53904/g.135465 Transcript_53904/m.135465 type:complete len:234 (-) Transcript_53904:235-936(-)